MPDIVNDIDAMACDWATRVAQGTLTDSDAVHLQQWLSADTRHRGAFVRAQAGWQMLTRIARTQGSGAAVEEPAAAVPPRRFRLPRLAVAATAAAIVTAAAFTLWLDRAREYRSGVGEVRSIVLADGSTATIGSRSEIEVAMAEGRRSLSLGQGEAWFDVAHDPQRPFIVSAGDVQVRAVGTAFAVTRIGEGVDVLVSEGTVEAYRGDGRRLRATAGQTLHFGADARAPATRTMSGIDEIERRLGWRQGLIILDGEPLQSAAARFNRHNRVQIVIQDASLGAVRLTGRFKATEAVAFARAAGHIAQASIVEHEDRIILSK